MSVDSPGSSIRYTEICPDISIENTTYLLLHGLGGSLEQWNEVQRRLGESARVVAVDIPGFGQSRNAGRTFDVHSVSDTIIEFCEEREMANCVLVSHSIGSVIASLLATRRPDLFARVVFVSGSLFRAAQIAQRPVLALRYPRLGVTVTGQFFAGLFPVPPWARRLIARSKTIRQVVLWPFVAHPRRLDARILEEALAGSGSPAAVLRILVTAKSIDYVGIISAVRQPVSLIWGGSDRLISEYDLREMRAAVAVERERRIDDCAHWAMVESPSEVVDFIRRR